MPFLLRVELPDVPGSLGRVASTIGEAGADIDAVEIVEHRPSGTAVDDFLLDMPPGVMPDSIVSACNQLDGVQVLWVSRYAAGGNLFLDLEAVEALTETPGSALDELVEVMPQTFRADWAVRVRLGDHGLKTLHATLAAPDLDDSQAVWFPCERASRLDVHPDWERLAQTVVAGARLTDPSEMVVFGRRGGPEVLDSEVARLEHLAALAVTISRR